MIRAAFGNLPSLSALFLDYTSNWERVRKFYPQNYTLESILGFSRQRPALDSSHLERLSTALEEQQKHWRSGTSADRSSILSIEKLASGAVAVMTGQQPGLFTGPFYAILKALTAIELAKCIDAAGIPAVPVFWIASEDHDFEEICWASFLDKDSVLQTVRVNLANNQASPVGWLQFGSDVTTAVEQCLSSLPQSEFQRDVQDMLHSCYGPGKSPVNSFASMMTRLFDGTGLILADPLHPELKRLALPTLSQAVRQNTEIRAAVVSRSRALSDAGYHAQVKVDEKFTGLFAFRGRSREAVRPGEDTADLMLSPNALLRPVVQDSIFPTVAYVGGPAEIDYFAQAVAVYETLGRTVPPVVPRISATLLEARVFRSMKKYEIDFVDALRGKDFLRQKAIDNAHGGNVFDTVKDGLVAQLEVLRPSLNAVDPTLIGALDTSRSKILHQVETLRTRFMSAEVRRNQTLQHQLEVIANSLYPEKKLQERVINVSSFLVRYGPALLNRLETLLVWDSPEHQIVDIS